nr:hypothetical protein [Massilia sp. CCM 8734]
MQFRECRACQPLKENGKNRGNRGACVGVRAEFQAQQAELLPLECRCRHAQVLDIFISLICPDHRDQLGFGGLDPLDPFLTGAGIIERVIANVDQAKHAVGSCQDFPLLRQHGTREDFLRDEWREFGFFHPVEHDGLQRQAAAIHLLPPFFDLDTSHIKTLRFNVFAILANNIPCK